MYSINSTMLNIGRVPQYFFDNAVIEQVQDITRVIHSPDKEEGPLIKNDCPWERIPYFACNAWNVIHDEPRGEFKCWYEDWDFDPITLARTGKYLNRTWICYACSNDGYTWQKPALDYYKEDGRKTNVVFGIPGSLHVHAATILNDPLESDREKQYKMVCMRYPTDGKIRQIVTANSKDGLKWKMSDEQLQFGRLGPNLCDVLILTADIEARVYRLTTRHPDMYEAVFDERRPITNSFFDPVFPHDVGRTNKRRIFQSLSSDLIHWSHPQCILAHDVQEDNIDDSYYGMVEFRLGDLHVGLLNVLHGVSDTMDVRLVYSRDGWRWHHLNQRQPWLTPTPDAWDRYMVNIPNVPIPVGDELFVYYGGAKNHHDWWITGLKEGLDAPEAHSLDEVEYGLGLAKLRRDGFISIDAGSVREGVLVTRALRTDGRNLVLNAACRNGGYIQVEVTDTQEKVLAGFSRAQCDAFSGDSTKVTITWSGKSYIPYDNRLRLRFFLRNASLYSFAFS